jgi:predicted nucleotidyltransferase
VEACQCRFFLFRTGFEEENRMERARELIRPYLEREGVIGIYVVGSATRPFRDERSDYDIEVVVEDELYRSLPDEERHVFVIDEGPPRKVDHEFYLWPFSEFADLIGSTLDLYHYPYQHAVILYDPEGRIGEVVKALSVLPTEVRQARMKAHYLEFLFGLHRAKKTFERGSALNGRLVSGEAVGALVKLLFLTKGSWPATRYWSECELEQIKVEKEIVRLATEMLTLPENVDVEGTVERVQGWLEKQGETFHRDYPALVHWAYLTKEGKQAFRDWGGR